MGAGRYTNENETEHRRISGGEVKNEVTKYSSAVNADTCTEDESQVGVV